MDGNVDLGPRFDPVATEELRVKQGRKMKVSHFSLLCCEMSVPYILLSNID